MYFFLVNPIPDASPKLIGQNVNGHQTLLIFTNQQAALQYQQTVPALRGFLLYNTTEVINAINAAKQYSTFTHVMVDANTDSQCTMDEFLTTLR